MDSAKARQSYWARNYVGWPRFSTFQPNITHLTLAEWEKKGKIQCVVTQNVDRLHHKAGSTNVHELHGKMVNHSGDSPKNIFESHRLKNDYILILDASVYVK